MPSQEFESGSRLPKLKVLVYTVCELEAINSGPQQGFSQDLETGCPIVKFWGIQIFKGDHKLYSYFKNKNV